MDQQLGRDEGSLKGTIQTGESILAHEEPTDGAQAIQLGSRLYQDVLEAHVGDQRYVRGRLTVSLLEGLATLGAE